MTSFLLVTANNVWIMAGILISAFIYAGLLPYGIRTSLKHIDIDMEKHTLSFLSNKKLYEEKYQKKYARVLFIAAIFNFAFFGLLTQYYQLGEHEILMRYLIYSSAFLTLLAFVPHNLKPFSFQNLKPFIQRLLHNLLAILIFLTLPSLIIIFQIAVLPLNPFIGISGLIIAGLFLIIVLLSLIFNGINGITELLFIDGLSIWCIWTASITILF